MVFPLRVQDHLMKPSQVLFAHLVHVLIEAPSRKSVVLLLHPCAHHPHSVPIATLTHTPPVSANPLRAWWTGLQPVLLTSHCLLTFWAGEVSCLHPGIVLGCEQANMVAAMESWPEEDLGGSFPCGRHKRMGPTDRWLLLAKMLNQVFLFSKPRGIWCYVQSPAFHLCPIFVYMCVLSVGC